MKEKAALAVVGTILLVCFALSVTGCAIKSDGKFEGSVENPFPWAADSRPAITNADGK